MTKETKVLKSTVFLPSKASSFDWKDQILSYSQSINKLEAVQDITNRGFNIDAEKNKLTQYYEKLIKKVGQLDESR